jgi:hypothetical protein
VSDAVDTVLFDLDDTICRYERAARLDEEMEGVSAEADGALGDVPEW